MSDELILVDIHDHPVGHGEKLAVHRQGLLHRAFSVFLLDGDRMLVQQRAVGKYHSGGLWANACCSHPRQGEALSAAVPRRLMEEAGIACEVEEAFHFVYRAVFPDGLVEYELDHVFIGAYGGAFSPDPGEIQAMEYVDLATLSKRLTQHPEQFAPWFLTAAPRVLEIWSAHDK